MNTLNMKNLKTASLATALTALATVISGCYTNSNLEETARRNLPQAASSPTADSTVDAVTTATRFKITSVTIATSGSQGTKYTARMMFDATQTTPLNSVCTYGTGANNTKPCICQFKWQDVDTNSTSSAPLQHIVKTPVSITQSAALTCDAPTHFGNVTEIKNNTTIRIKVLPAPGNTSSFSTNEYLYVKRATTSTGAFQDNKGTSFDNILRYTCYEQYKRGMEVKNRTSTIPNTQTGESRKMYMASQFIVNKASGTNNGTPEDGLKPPQYSAQTYYYNLYTSDSKPEWNLENARFVCPQVTEQIRVDAPEQGKFYPQDRSFALSITKTQEYTVGVEAFATLNSGNDNLASVPTSCSSKAPPTSPADGLVQKCLGFAARPNPDGTCPRLTDSSGLIRFTYRLRRYVALYPPLYDTDGGMLPQNQSVDTVYVLDRPVTSPNADPLKPYTMLGPKPCPFAVFDHKGLIGDRKWGDFLDSPVHASVEDYSDHINGNNADANYNGSSTNGRIPGYVAMSDPRWNYANNGYGFNPDGIEFPNNDSANSCSTALPLWESTSKWWSIGTVNNYNPTKKMKRVFIRPVKAWAPHYVEDTNFQACAPMPSPTIIDPPLHFQKDSNGNVAWCAEVYPSQNSYPEKIDKLNSTATAFIGKVTNYTSHKTKNTSNARCTYSSLAPKLASLVPSYPSDPNDPNKMGRAYHHLWTWEQIHGETDDKETCDRTVRYAQNSSWAAFPLLAPPRDVEETLTNDIKSYGCLMTYDNGGGKVGKYSPAGGCCGSSVYMKTTTPDPASWSACKNAGTDCNNAHLEPAMPCMQPGYE